MSQLHYKFFSLFPKSAINAKHGLTAEPEPIQGLNFKLTHKNENLYASVTLHPSLGDSTPNDYLESLKNNIPYVLMDNFKEEFKLKSLERYFLDFMSHDLITHATVQKNTNAEEDLKVALGLYKRGFHRIKFKMTQDFFKDHSLYYNFLNHYKNIEFIFDFNSTVSFQDLKDIKWSKECMARSYWEDPVGLQDLESLQALKALGFQLILDQKNMTFHQRLKPLVEIFDIVAVKPTKESVLEVLEVFPSSKLLITTNMGNELDHAISAHWANYVYAHHRDRFFGAGLYTRHFFKSQDLLAESLQPDSLAAQKNQELNPKVRVSFLDLNLKDKLRGWGLDHDMMRMEWTYLRDLDVEF